MHKKPVSHENRSYEPTRPSWSCQLLVYVLMCAIILGLFHVPEAQCKKSKITTQRDAFKAQQKKKSLNKKKQIDQKRKELKKKVREARKKERLAYWDLRKTKRKLNSTKKQLRKNTSQINNTVKKMNDTQTNLRVTQIWTDKQADAAGKRLREMYEGHRLSFLEMVFQSDSMQKLIDRMYYQSRIAEQDKNLLDKLKAQAQALAANRNRLNQQKNQLASMVSEIKKRAEEFAKQKGSKERIARKLRKQRAFYEKTERQLAQQSKALESQILSMESKAKSKSKKSNKKLVKGSGRFAMPLKARMTSPFGWRRHPIFRKRRFHTGIDLAGPRRSKIRASDSGHVIHSGWYGGYGRVVIVSHGNGFSTLYAHLTKAMVKKGQNVKKGDVIGLEGSTGFATGPHLHFEVRVKGKPKNPLKYVK